MKELDNQQVAPKRILHITFNMGYGGTEQVICQLVKNLPEARFSNEILCIDGEVGQLGQNLRSEHGFTIHTLRRQPGLDWRLALKIHRLIKNGRFNVVHCHQYTPWFYGWLGSLGTRVRLVFTEHGRFYPDRHRRKAWLVNKIMSKTTDAVVAISNATREALEEFEYIPRGHVHVIYNGIKYPEVSQHQVDHIRKEYGIDSKDFVLGTVARLDPVKNQRMIVEAFSKFIISNPSSRLLLVGDGPEREGLKSLVDELDLKDRIIFCGFQSIPYPYLAAMDVFLLASDTEGTSMTLLEAMSLGIPIVATRAGGTPEIIDHNSNGFLCNMRDPADMLKYIESIKKDRGLANKMSQNGRILFQDKFSDASMVKQYAKVYAPTSTRT